MTFLFLSARQDKGGGGKAGATASSAKQDSIADKKHELEKRLQDVSGQLTNSSASSSVSAATTTTTTTTTNTTTSPNKKTPKKGILFFLSLCPFLISCYGRFNCFVHNEILVIWKLNYFIS